MAPGGPSQNLELSCDTYLVVFSSAGVAGVAPAIISARWHPSIAADSRRQECCSAQSPSRKSHPGRRDWSVRTGRMEQAGWSRSDGTNILLVLLAKGIDGLAHAGLEDDDNRRKTNGNRSPDKRVMMEIPDTFQQQSTMRKRRGMTSTMDLDSTHLDVLISFDGDYLWAICS